MSSEEAFLQAIRETPDDDVPRLVYADWLDDHGRADRAELIRVQCRLARLPEEERARPTLLAQEQELLRAFSRDNAATLRKLVVSYELRRGFVEAAKVRPGVLFRHGEALFRHTLLREVRLYGHYGQPVVAQLADCP